MKDTYRMMHFIPGKEVWYKGSYYIVEHVMLRNTELYIRLHGVHSPVHSNEVACESTVFSLKRI